ncbi:MAG TPA: glycerol kinase GlpK [Sphingomicrobium sp.]|nr:glycerol kinase GlpK [Sphingomicrobium sp.]
MGQADHVLAIDQGTTSTRAILFDSHARAVSVGQREHRQHYPKSGWVEHDPEEIWANTLGVAREALSAIDLGRVAAIGITNQRETVVVWDRSTGEPIYPAIVWQDRRTAEACTQLRADGVESLVRERTGLLLDPYFSAAKIAWVLDHVPGARARGEGGELACGTIDCFLLWRLSGGAVHATDPTNAARTSLLDIHRQCWDPELCRLFRVPEALLPEVHDNSHLFGTTASNLFGVSLPIAGMAGDQQAALFGQACFEPAMVKSTYGTGCFMLANTGEKAIASGHRLLTTPAYRLAGKTTYALEGSIFVAGAAIKWLRDGLGVIADASETDSMATRVPDSHGVIMVPAFVGLGAPYWDPLARGAIFGLTLDASGAHLARAALEAVAYQSFDLLEAMAKDGAGASGAVRVDGGMAANAWLCQFLADILDVPVERPENLETTALGAAFLAGLTTGVWGGLDDLARTWTCQQRFESHMDEQRRSELIGAWKSAVAKVLS